MATTPFAYNPSQATIAGSTNLVDLSIGSSSQDYSSKPGGVTWWMGPDDATGYLICRPVPAGNQPTQLGAIGTVRFARSTAKTDQSFLDLANYLKRDLGGTADLASASAALTWLNSNGYWTSWVQPYVAGLYKTTYSGYFADNVSFFATATPQTFGSNPATSVQTTAITEPGTDDGSSFSCQWLGYFKPTTTETYTFFTASDDASYMWIGNSALSGFTVTNAVVKNGGLHGVQEQSGTIALTAGVYYPIRIQFGELNGGDALTFNYSTPTISKTTNVTGLVFYNSSTNNF
jgi:hypothetical protein